MLYVNYISILIKETSLVVQWNALLHCRGTGSLPGQGAKVPHATCYGQRKKKVKNETAQVLEKSLD